ncbi:hypothetical protein HDU96_005204 [Phlyctochytrium bullatum]|nr:hypothetical protein HDU96_005204 [Phlyctochytrium bullatum]
MRPTISSAGKVKPRLPPYTPPLKTKARSPYPSPPSSGSSKPAKNVVSAKTQKKRTPTMATPSTPSTCSYHLRPPPSLGEDEDEDCSPPGSPLVKKGSHSFPLPTCLTQAPAKQHAPVVASPVTPSMPPALPPSRTISLDDEAAVATPPDLLFETMDRKIIFADVEHLLDEISPLEEPLVELIYALQIWSKTAPIGFGGDVANFEVIALERFPTKLDEDWLGEDVDLHLDDASFVKRASWMKDPCAYPKLGTPFTEDIPLCDRRISRLWIADGCPAFSLCASA